MILLSEVMAVYKIMPSEQGTDLSKVEASLREKVNVKKVEREPIAFGLVALKVTIFMMDAEGETDRVEERMKEVEGVGEVEVLEVTRLM